MPEKLRTRPWTEHYASHAKLHRQQVNDIKTPVINTYAKQLQKYDRLYNKITEEHRTTGDRLPQISTTDTRNFSHVFSKSAPGTFYYEGPYSIERLEWSLTSQFRERRLKTEFIDVKRNHQDNTEETQSESEYSEKLEINPFQLSEILHRRGLEKPVMICYDKNGKEIKKTKTPKIRNNTGALPKNPSLREKIKGRARLDYEMANMRAAAFCENQAQRKFRTASAITRNRDVEFVEEDFLERIKRENNNEINNNDDDTGSIIMSVDKDELFERIDKWVTDVNKSLRETVHPTSKTDFQEKVS